MTNPAWYCTRCRQQYATPGWFRRHVIEKHGHDPLGDPPKTTTARASCPCTPEQRAAAQRSMD